MQKTKKILITITALMVLTFGLFLIACSDNQDSQVPGIPISVNNDSVVFSDLGNVTDPWTGKTVGSIQSGGVEFDSLGSIASPSPYVSQGDLAALTLGISPLIKHGDMNGDLCMSCHSTGSGGAPFLTLSHVEAGLDNSYCRGCHVDAE